MMSLCKTASSVAIEKIFHNLNLPQSDVCKGSLLAPKKKKASAIFLTQCFIASFKLKFLKAMQYVCVCWVVKSSVAMFEGCRDCWDAGIVVQAGEYVIESFGS